MLTYNFLDIPRLYTAMAEWAGCMMFLPLLGLRFKKLKTALICALALGLQEIFLIVTDDVPIYLWVPCMVVAFLMMSGLIIGICPVTKTDGLFYSFIAFVTAELTASICWQILCTMEVYISWKFPDYVNVIGTVAFVVVFYGGIDILIALLLRAHMPEGGLHVGRRELMAGTIMTVSIFAASNFMFLLPRMPENGDTVVILISMRGLIDVGGIAILYAYMLHICETRTRQELMSVQNVLENQYLQYKMSRESINLINYKYHDLKHQIAILRAEEDSDKRNEFLNHMEEEIKNYELQNRTGNSVLDTILTSKSMYCQKHNIQMTAVCDGALLEFMDIMDLCSVFGNALDNAIEGELKIADHHKRLIHVTVSGERNFAIIQVENYLEQVPDIQENRIRTTKENKDLHGYGLKSMQYIAEKYKGVMNIRTENHWFILQMMLPM